MEPRFRAVGASSNGSAGDRREDFSIGEEKMIEPALPVE